MSRKTLPDVLATRIVRRGCLLDLLTDAVLRQEIRWITDQQSGRRSVI